MKTIFISILAGVEAKNILRTNVLKKIMEPGDIRVVLFLKSKERVAFYQKEFNYPNLIYEVIATYRGSFLDRWFEFLKHYLVRTGTLFLYKKLVLADKRNYLSYYGSCLLSFIIGRKFFRRIARFVDFHFISDPTFDPYFEKYQPHAVFLANLFDPQEISLLRMAKQKMVPTIGFINSWDKVTSKGFVRLLPDKLLVPNDNVQVEALELTDISSAHLSIVGVPQYDAYTTKDGIISREEFFRKINADPTKPLIVFCPMGLAFSQSDWNVIDILHELIEKRLKYPAELLVRFQPNDFFEKSKLESRPWLRYDLPGTRFGTERGIDWDMTGEELLHLKNTLYHASLLVAYASSIVIDIAMFDRPIININFEVKNDQPAIQTPTLRYKTVHYQKALATGGIRLVNSLEELVEWVDRYLDDTSLDKDGRARLVTAQCFKADGKSGERIAGAVLKLFK